MQKFNLHAYESRNKLLWIYVHIALLLFITSPGTSFRKSTFSEEFCKNFRIFYRDHPLSTHTLKEREGVKEKAYIYCFFDVILLFESVQGERRCLKITKFERTYFMDGPILYFARIHVIFIHINYLCCFATTF